MIIWWSLLIPVIAAVFMLLFFRTKVTWWESVIPLVVCLIFIIVFKSIVNHYIIQSTKFKGNLITSAQYYESYETWHHETCSHLVTVSKTTTTVYYDCSHCDETSPQWTMETKYGESYNITQSFYNKLIKQWSAKPQFVELNRNIDYHGSCGKDGDMYQILWNNNPLTSEAVVKKHEYENKVQVAHSSFDFLKVTEEDKKTYGLYEYPPFYGYDHQESLLGLKQIKWLSGPAEYHNAQKLAEYINGFGGPQYHAKVFFLLFVDKPQLSAFMQESYWNGGNSNEMVICIGLNSKNRKLEWVKPFSWTPNRQVIVDIRENIMNLKTFDFNKIYNTTYRTMFKFKPRDFKEFSYITVDPPLWCVYVTFIVTLLLSCGMMWWSINNNLVPDENDPLKTKNEDYY